MNREIPNEWFTPSYQDRPRRPHEAGTYPAPPRSGHQVGTWWPELLQQFIDRQDIRYESARDYARHVAKTYLDGQLGVGVDPDQLLITTLYINEQDREPARARLGPSMTLTDALMRNWQQNGNGQFWEHLGHLRDYRKGGYPARIEPGHLELADCFAYEAIYHKTDPQRFDASTHVAIDPQAFKRFVWEADLQSHYESSLKDFWKQHGDDYNLLLKAALLKSAYVQYEEGSLSLEDKALVLKALGLDTSQSWETLTLVAFRDAPMTRAITFRELVLYRYVSTDIIVIQHENTGRLLMYVPGNSSPIHAFKNMSQLRDWVVRQCKDARRRAILETHFKVEDEPDGSFLSGLQTTLAGLAAHPHRLNDATGHWWPSREITLGPVLSPWPFSHFKESLKGRLASDGLQLIRSRADYNKEVAALVLSNAIVAVGAVAMVAPYLWAPLAAMSLALTGLGVDEMINGRTLEEKQQGSGRIVFGLLNAVPVVFEGGAQASRILGAARRVGDEVVPGAADEVGQMIESRSPGEKAAALGKQQQHEAQVISEAKEQAAESAGERQLRLHEEEAERLAAKAHRKAGYDSAMVFGVEPEGLRSLPPNLRAELAEFEYNAPLEPGGSWTIDDFGAVYTIKDRQANATRYFARVHSKLYPVKRVDFSRQYRVFSLERPAIKGPFIKQTKGYYSDIDLKSGLRGGDSYIEVASAQESVPEAVRNGIELVRAQPPFSIEIPLDGIKAQATIDGWGQPARKYYALTKPEPTPVRYDADIGGWRKYNGKLIWLDKKGVWRTGNEKAFLKVRDKLGSGISSELYKFPRLPGYPSNAQALDRTVHQIWLGEKIPNARLIDTIKTNAQVHPEIKFILHLDVDNAAFSGELSRLHAAFAEHSNLSVSQLSDEPFFSDFLNDTETAVPFRYFRSGEGQNLAAASDVLRYRLIHEYGGIYMDCDDVIHEAIATEALKAGPHDVLMGGPVSSPRMAFFGPGNSHFASHPGNPVLREVQKELYSRFIAEFDTLKKLGAQRSAFVNGAYPYMSKVFEVTGPRLFLETLKKVRPDYADLLDLKIKPRPGILSFAYLEYLEEVTDFYTPFARRLKITAGAENSWATPG